MSRIGKKLIEIPAGVKVAFGSGSVQVAGPLGNLELAVRFAADHLSWRALAAKTHVFLEQVLNPRVATSAT